MADQRQRVERVLDVALYAPVGLALTLRDKLPRRLRQHRQAIQNRVQLARFIGELAVRYGRAEIDRELRERRAAEDAAVTIGWDSEPASTDVRVPGTVPGTVRGTHTGAEAPPDVDLSTEDGEGDDSLPIGDYESLAAIHVVHRLGSLRADEIEQIRRFESTHRARRTVLAKIAQLQDASTA